MMSGCQLTTWHRVLHGPFATADLHFVLLQPKQPPAPEPEPMEEPEAEESPESDVGMCFYNKV